MEDEVQRGMRILGGGVLGGGEENVFEGVTGAGEGAQTEAGVASEGVDEGLAEVGGIARGGELDGDEAGGVGDAGPVRGFQRAEQQCGGDGVLSARPALVQPHDLWR